MLDAISNDNLPANADVQTVINAIANSHDRMHSSVKRLRTIEERYLADGHDDALGNHTRTHIDYVNAINAEKGKLEEAAKSMSEQLNRERAERELERQGYQNVAKLSTNQARHFAELCRAADMRIDELERTIQEHTIQAAKERMQAQQSCK